MSGLTEDDIDRPSLVFGKLVMHEPNMMVRFADYLRSTGIEGRVAVVGDDVLPGMSDRVLRRHTPQIEWVAEHQLLEGPQLVKSARELEIYREAGALVSAALDAAMKEIIAGKRSCEAAARAASVLMAGGGGFHRISINHGPMMENGLSKAYYGYDTRAPSAGDLVTVWIYGPIFAGYWLDPGRTAICGARPTAAQSALVEDCANYVEKMTRAIAPGMTPPRGRHPVGRDRARRRSTFDARASGKRQLGARLRPRPRHALSRVTSCRSATRISGCLATGAFRRRIRRAWCLRPRRS